jgi:hypothetical protein
MDDTEMGWSEIDGNKRIALLDQKINKEILQSVALILTIQQRMKDMNVGGFTETMPHIVNSLVERLLILGTQATELAGIINNQNKNGKSD